MNLTMPTPEEVSAGEGLAAYVAQILPVIRKTFDKLKPLVDQPIIRFPWNLPLITSQVIPANQTGVVLPASNFAVGLEYPFEVHKVKFSQDPAHTFRDWRVAIQDQTFSQDMQNNPTMVALAIDDNTGAWKVGDPFPWIVRPKGGGLTVRVDNLDAVNPITVDISFQGYLMIPR